jgi:hypothetical protein
MPGPDSSYSCFEHQRFWNVESDARMEPPIQTEYLRSGGATILTFMLLGESDVSSFCMRSAIPGNMVVPPERTTLPYKSRRMSRSHLKIELYVVSWIPVDSRPMNEGWKRASGARKLKKATPSEDDGV